MADSSSSSSSSKATAKPAGTKEKIAQWEKLTAELKEKVPRKLFKLAARVVANEIQEGNRNGYIQYENKPKGSTPVSNLYYVYELGSILMSDSIVNYLLNQPLNRELLIINAFGTSSGSIALMRKVAL